jgi:hypothetical protein
VQNPDAAGRLPFGPGVSARDLPGSFAARRHHDRPPQVFLFGTTQFGLGPVVLVIGGRSVSDTENALIRTFELPLAVAWVWVCFYEMPAGSALLAASSSRPPPPMPGTAAGPDADRAAAPHAHADRLCTRLMLCVTPVKHRPIYDLLNAIRLRRVASELRIVNMVSMAA